jgi:hypothetical protein
MAEQLGWDAARTQRELEAWRELAGAEGLVPEPAAVAHAKPAPAPEEPSPTAPGAAPEEAA